MPSIKIYTINDPRTHYRYTLVHSPSHDHYQTAIGALYCWSPLMPGFYITSSHQMVRRYLDIENRSMAEQMTNLAFYLNDGYQPIMNQRTLREDLRQYMSLGVTEQINVVAERLPEYGEIEIPLPVPMMTRIRQPNQENNYRYLIGE